MVDILAEFTQRDIFMLLCGGGIVGGLSIVCSAVFEKLFDIYDAKKRNVRPFDGWKGGRL